MHQVYDDDMTFKLVTAASKVSGLPVEVCLEEFGKHFLVYCQKNGYDQILRVLGSNLYDFLTNLDNLHDHLASIYPGMRAPSFRVTRSLNTNRQQQQPAGGGGNEQVSGGAQVKQQQQQQQGDSHTNNKHELNDSSSSSSSNNTNNNNNNKHNNQAAAPSPSPSGSMYLHYYSERAGLSPIVKGLVMAVAKEFFETDIVVTECQATSPSSAAGPADDHVVLKIDRRAPEQGEAARGQQQQQFEPSQPQPRPQPEAVAATAAAAGSSTRPHQPQQLHLQPPSSSSSLSASALIQSKSMLNIYDSLSTNANDSLVSSEIMMQTFPFHVIFDRQFNLVQVGKSLLRVTSLYWQRRAEEQRQQQQQQLQQRDLAAASAASKPAATKFSDLFGIVRPKIDFTFDAIADHTNQVFVVKTKPLVLNADYRRCKRLSSSGSSSTTTTGGGAVERSVAPPPKPLMPPMCPMDRIAMAARQQRASGAAIAPNNSQQSPPPPEPPSTGAISATTEQAQVQAAVAAATSASAVGQLDDLGDPPVNHLSLRLKGQMIILLGGELCLYLCSPRVDHLNQLMECGVNMSDFALHDRARELMLMSHTHKEDREAVKKLDQASNDLKKMDTKLRQENKRTNEVLHNIFPAKIAALLSHGHKVESESFDLVTCLYSDIIGFTKMCGSENVRPIDIVRLLNTLYLQFDNLTNIHGVFKVETIGDAYVVVGGLPEPAEDHADRCVKMGLDMVKVIATVRSPADNQPIQMRIGIHSGPVMAGIVGIRVPRYSLFGNTTTQANQLETNGVGGKIHISDFTLKNLIKRDRFVVEDNPNEISGIPFVTYFVTNYLGDENETLQHEKILEEQLIKDFELMGNELELVDDSASAYDQLYASYESATATATTAATRSSSLALGQSPQPPSSSAVAPAPAPINRRLSAAAMDLRRRSSQAAGQQSGSGPAATHAADAALQPSASSSLSAAAASVQAGRKSSPRRPLPFGESLAKVVAAANNDDDGDDDGDGVDQYERLILMDIEDQRSEKQWMAGQLARMSDQLSSAIIADAIKQVDMAGCGQQQRRQQQSQSLLALLFGPQSGQLELVGRRLAAAAATGTAEAVCPLCAGCGLLDSGQADVVRLKLSPVELSSGRRLATAATRSSGRGDCAAVATPPPPPPPSANCSSSAAPQLDAQRRDRRARIGRLVEWLRSQLTAEEEQQEEAEMNGVHLGATHPAVSTAAAAAATHERRQLPRAKENRATAAAAAGADCTSCRQRRQRSSPTGGGGSTSTNNQQDELDLLRRVQRGSQRRRRQSIERLLAELCASEEDEEEQEVDIDYDDDDDDEACMDQQRPATSAAPDRRPVRLSASGAPLKLSIGGANDGCNSSGGSSSANTTPTTTDGRRSPAGSSPRSIGVGRVLSSNIQRMKRMDTLKRRKLKKEEDKQQAQREQLGGLTKAAAAALATRGPSGASLLPGAADTRLALSVETGADGLRRASATPSMAQVTIAEEEAETAEEEEEEDDDDDDDDEYEAVSQVAAGGSTGAQQPVHVAAMVAVRGPPPLNRDTRHSDESASADPREPRGYQMQAAVAANTTAKVSSRRPHEQLGGVVVSAQIHTVREPLVVVAPSSDGDHNGHEHAVEHERAPAPVCDGRRPSSGGGGGGERHRATSAYSYQNLKSSLANLVNGVHHHHQSQQDQQRTPTKRFHLNPFAGLTFTSPFSSPIKRAAATAAAGTQQQQSRGGNKRTTTETERRKQSSRSQSSGSAGAASPAGRSRVREGSNCSCLKSSASSQSIDSMDLK